MSKASETAILNAFRNSAYAPEGEWWTEFPLGLTFKHGNERKVDGLCVTSRTPIEPSQERPVDWFRDRQSEGWLDGERVVLVEVKGTEDSWKALGQIRVYEKLFEMDWNASIEELIIVIREDIPGEDSKELLKNHFDRVDLYLYGDGVIHQ